jgi:hypothetical protein
MPTERMCKSPQNSITKRKVCGSAAVQDRIACLLPGSVVGRTQYFNMTFVRRIRATSTSLQLVHVFFMSVGGPRGSCSIISNNLMPSTVIGAHLTARSRLLHIAQTANEMIRAMLCATGQSDKKQVA